MELMNRSSLFTAELPVIDGSSLVVNGQFNFSSK